MALGAKEVAEPACVGGHQVEHRQAVQQGHDDGWGWVALELYPGGNRPIGQETWHPCQDSKPIQ